MNCTPPILWRTLAWSISTLSVHNKRSNLMANDHQFKLRTQFIATRGVKEYRATIPTIVQAKDVVLELGCEWGSTTRLIAPYALDIIGTDISAEAIQRARLQHPTLHFEVLDAF